MYVVLLFDDVYAIFNKLYDKKNKKQPKYAKATTSFCFYPLCALTFWQQIPLKH